MKFDPATGKGWAEFQTLQDQTYMELGTGVDNIFKVFRIDLVWSIAYPSCTSGETIWCVWKFSFYSLVNTGTTKDDRKHKEH